MIFWNNNDQRFLERIKFLFVNDYLLCFQDEGLCPFLLPLLEVHHAQAHVGTFFSCQSLRVYMCIYLAIFRNPCFLDFFIVSGSYNLSSSRIPNPLRETEVCWRHSNEEWWFQYLLFSLIVPWPSYSQVLDHTRGV